MKKKPMILAACAVLLATVAATADEPTVTVCHRIVGPRRPAQYQTLVIPVSQLFQHTMHNDQIGACPVTP